LHFAPARARERLVPRSRLIEDMHSLDRFAAGKLDALDRDALRRRLVDTARDTYPWVMRDGKRLLSFSCNDYLGLSTHPAVKAAAIDATQRFGVGAGASRLVTGNHPLYAVLEARLAAQKGTQAACVFGSGYLANIGVIGALVGADDLILLDDLSHACLYAGAQLSRAKVMTFRHNDVAHAAALLDAHRREARRVLLVTETVFSMDGDRAPMAGLGDLCQRHDAWLLSDDAHGFGVLPHDPAMAQVPLQMGTLSKALGAYGGYLCASQPVVELAVAALDIIAADPALAAEPLRKAQLFTAALGLPQAESPIVPLVLGAPESALRASTLLAAEGFLVTAIRPPTVPPGTARLRFAFSAAHADADIVRLSAVIATQLVGGLNAAPGMVAT
jgi:8-amino-7-oxononanoate synthase